MLEFTAVRWEHLAFVSKWVPHLTSFSNVLFRWNCVCGCISFYCVFYVFYTCCVVVFVFEKYLYCFCIVFVLYSAKCTYLSGSSPHPSLPPERVTPAHWLVVPWHSVHSVHWYTLDIAHWSQYTVQCSAVHWVHIEQWTVHSAQQTVHSEQCPLASSSSPGQSTSCQVIILSVSF